MGLQRTQIALLGWLMEPFRAAEQADRGGVAKAWEKISLYMDATHGVSVMGKGWAPGYTENLYCISIPWYTVYKGITRYIPVYFLAVYGIRRPLQIIQILFILCFAVSVPL
jgi:hypothetical protein